MNYYNEWDKDAAAWLRELIKADLIPAGDVDERSITEVKAHELTDYRQCHFFAGVGGWPLAFKIAGIDPSENADTGSCPCQPFSGTGKQMGFADPRHLWPALRRIEGRRQAAKIYGEQVGSKLGREWLARVFSDLAFMGYAGTGADLCSAGVGSPNIRQRLYWVGDADLKRCAGIDPLLRQEATGRNAPDISQASGRGATDWLEHAAGDGRQQWGSESDGRGASGGCGIGGMDDATGDGREQIRCDASGDSQTPCGRKTDRTGHGSKAGNFWSPSELILCRDFRNRRIEPGSFPLAHGIPSRVGPLLTELRKLGRSSIALARANRNFRLKGYGNAINPWVAARFIAATRGGVPGLIEDLD